LPSYELPTPRSGHFSPNRCLDFTIFFRPTMFFNPFLFCRPFLQTPVVRFRHLPLTFFFLAYPLPVTLTLPTFLFPWSPVTPAPTIHLFLHEFDYGILLSLQRQYFVHFRILSLYPPPRSPFLKIAPRPLCYFYTPITVAHPSSFFCLLSNSDDCDPHILRDVFSFFPACTFFSLK